MSQTNQTTPSLVEVLTPAYIANPYALYRQMREIDPIYWDERINSWVLCSYTDNVSALRDARFSVQGVMANTGWIPEGMRETLEPPIRALTRQMLFLDPPDHTRLRALVAKAFTPRVAEALRPTIQQIADELLDTAQANGRIELIREFAYPLPAIVIATMLGVPPEDRDQFNTWSWQLRTLLDGSASTLEGYFQALSGISEFLEYFRQIIRKRRTAPKDDLLQAMINVEEQGDTLSEEELLGNCVLIVAAGHGTTTHLIGNGTLALLRNPDQRAQLQAHPSLISSAVAELLRYDGPVQLTLRRAKEDLHIGAKAISAGQQVFLLLGAANHDPVQFSEPDQLNLRRPENRHLAFGLGIHFCLGAPLARVEGEIAFSTLLHRFPALRLETEEVEWLQSAIFRGLKQLPIVLS